MPSGFPGHPHCVRGHLVVKVGRDVGGGCCECRRLRQRKPNSDLFFEVRNPEPIPNLREVRLRLGLSQRDLAELSGIPDRSVISNIEHRRRRASDQTRDKIIRGVLRAQKRIKREEAWRKTLSV
jgi:DNA-binding XRE family transcriptional regulator